MNDLIVEDLSSKELIIEKTQIFRSKNRKATVAVSYKKGILYVNAPYDIAQDKLEEIINNCTQRLKKRHLQKELNKQICLKNIFYQFNNTYFENKLEINAIEYVTNQEIVFGSCYPQKKIIHISSRLAAMPDWVRNYVVIHEMAHLIEANHSKNFWDLVYRYPLTERARGYLIAIARDKEFNEDDI